MASRLVGKIDVVIFSIGFSNLLVCLSEGGCFVAVASFNMAYCSIRSSECSTMVVIIACRLLGRSALCRPAS
jgi:hypothetical protein